MRTRTTGAAAALLAAGIPPEQVVGSSIKVRYEERDKAGKPVGIHQFIGRRPVMAFGNSDGDFEMLTWTAAPCRPRFGLIVHHTDAGREWAYDRASHVGRLDKALDAAPKRGWAVVDMKNDWKMIYPPTK